MRAKEDELRRWKENKVYKEIEKKGEHGTINEMDNDKKDKVQRRVVEAKTSSARF